MTFQRRVGETRRSTRIPLTVLIAAQVTSGPLALDGETIVVNRHGALIFCTDPLRARLEKPENIWGISFPPDDWYETHES